MLLRDTFEAVELGPYAEGLEGGKILPISKSCSFLPETESVTFNTQKKKKKKKKLNHYRYPVE